eukprot:10477995-Ditylum_brightwellii.AAC.1
MTKTSTNMQWQNMANHQNGLVLSVLDPKLEGYKVSELYQWGMCMQLSAQGASSNTPVSKLGNKVKHLLLKLDEVYGKNTFTIHSKKEKTIQATMFQKTTTR